MGQQLLRLGVDERLLREIPHMFESFSDAVAELIQNAYRAGARRVAILVDHDRREVAVRDDGPGAPDPEPLLRAGLSGWGERVVEPAGLGLFALLGLAEHVVIESRFAGGQGWRVTITPETFHGAPVPLERFSAPGEPTGLTLRARLGERADLRLQTRAVDGVTFRHLFPVHVTLTEIRGGERDTTELPAPEWPAESVDTPVGRLAVHGWLGRGWGARLYLVWEHRVLMATAGWPDLRQVLEARPGGGYVAEALDGAVLYWAVDPASGVRPKLPDRREVVRDAAYLRAVEALAAALVRAFDAEAVRCQVEALHLPPEIDSPRRVVHRLASVRTAPIFRLDPEALLEMAGYVQCTWPRYDEWDEEHDLDGLTGLAFYLNRIWVKHPLRVRNRAAAHALCRQGVWAVYDPAGVEVEIVASGVRWAGGEERGLPLIGVCERLSAVRADTGEILAQLDLLTVAEDEADDLLLRCDPARPDDAQEGLCLWRVEPTAALEALRRRTGMGLEVLGFVLDVAQQTGRLWDWVATKDGRDTVDADAAAREIIAHVAGQLVPERAREEQRYSDLEALADRLHGLRRDVKSVLEDVQHARKTYPEVGELATLEALLQAASEQLVLPLTSYRPASLPAA